jgi:hypothetical protein
MIDECGREVMPYPFFDVPTDPRSFALNFSAHLTTLLENCAGLAGVCYAASKDPEAAERDLTEALFVLHEYLGCALALLARWKDPDAAEVPDPDC